MKLDKKAFAIKTFAQANNNKAYFLKKTPKERLAAAWYLTCIEYGLDPNKEHRMDKTFFRMKKRP